jgi:hypothetical protein
MEAQLASLKIENERLRWENEKLKLENRQLIHDLRLEQQSTEGLLCLISDPFMRPLEQEQELEEFEFELATDFTRFENEIWLYV